MNIKKHLVNGTSSTLSMIALVGGMTMFAGQAHAWGDREQGIVTGIFGTLLLQNLNGNHGHTTQPRYHAPQPTYNNHTTVIIQDNAWASRRVCQEQIIRRADGSQSTLQLNCAGRVVGEIFYNKY